MSVARLYTDENVYGEVAEQLRRRGFDALSVPQAGNLGLTDEEQLKFAISEGRTILTFDVGDFRELHEDYLRAGKRHCGIIVSEQIPIGEVVKRCVRFLSSLSAEEMTNRLEFLSSWK